MAVATACRPLRPADRASLYIAFIDMFLADRYATVGAVCLICCHDFVLFFVVASVPSSPCDEGTSGRFVRAGYATGPSGSFVGLKAPLAPSYGASGASLLFIHRFAC